jgi:hypothetical protein
MTIIDGRVVGLPKNLRIDYEKTRARGNRQIVMKVGARGKAIRYIDPQATWRDFSHEYKRITRARAVELAKVIGVAYQDPSFIALDVRSGGDPKSSMKRDHDTESESDEGDDGMHHDGRKKVDYRDIHGKSVYKDEDDDLMQSKSDQEEEGAESLLDVLIRRRMMLDGELRRVRNWYHTETAS